MPKLEDIIKTRKHTELSKPETHHTQWADSRIHVARDSKIDDKWPG